MTVLEKVKFYAAGVSGLFSAGILSEIHASIGIAIAGMNAIILGFVVIDKIKERTAKKKTETETEVSRVG